MQRTVLFGVLLLLPFGVIGVSLHDLVKRDAHKGPHWNYEEDAGPAHWHKNYDMCDGRRQSPINIVPSEVDLNDELDDFIFDNYDDAMENAIMENNGHTIQISPNPSDVARSFDEGGLDDQYQFLQLHFHWGKQNNRGSEHRINNMSFPLEMHLVHMNKNYKTKEMASKREDGLAVLGVLFELSKEDNPDLAPIIDKLKQVRKEGHKTKVDGIKLESLLPDDTMPYYRYEGSLTTPPCNEIVIWTIFKDLVDISEEQLDQFRAISEDDDGEPTEPLLDNFRPVQALNGRIVEISGRSNTASALGPSVVAVLTALALLLKKYSL